MTAPNRYHNAVSPPATATTHRAVKYARALTSWRERYAAHRRRVLAQWLRRTAHRAHDPDPIRRRRGVLLHYRAAAVRTELLDMAVILDHARDLDPECVAALRDLLSNACDSPLYNPDLHISELRTTLHYLHSRLAAGMTSCTTAHAHRVSRAPAASQLSSEDTEGP